MVFCWRDEDSECFEKRVYSENINKNESLFWQYRLKIFIFKKIVAIDESL